MFRAKLVRLDDAFLTAIVRALAGERRAASRSRAFARTHPGVVCPPTSPNSSPPRCSPSTAAASSAVWAEDTSSRGTRGDKADADRSINRALGVQGEVHVPRMARSPRRSRPRAQSCAWFWANADPHRNLESSLALIQGVVCQPYDITEQIRDAAEVASLLAVDGPRDAMKKLVCCERASIDLRDASPESLRNTQECLFARQLRLGEIVVDSRRSWLACARSSLLHAERPYTSDRIVFLGTDLTDG